MNAVEFFLVTGQRPEQDDLERANCERAGQLGHTCCGVCEHGKPLFMCHQCLMRAGTPGEVKRIAQS